MERRIVIKQILIMAGGLALLPSCLKEAGKSTILLKNINIDLDQENLLGEIAETIIPRTDTPGAKELNLHLYVLKMLDDCYSDLEQKQFVNGIEQLKDFVHHRHAKSFNKLSITQRQNILLDLEKSKTLSPELFAFYTIIKQRTIKGYLNSKYVMTSLIKYELVPGRYNGYFPVKSA